MYTVSEMDYNNYKKIIKDRLDDYRYHHSLCVAEQAVKLAEKYGADRNKAYLAGLLHDITKNDSMDEHLRNFNRFGIILTDVEKAAPKLWHAISGAAFVQKELSVEDTEIISAIRYHTTAKQDMTCLEKVIYLADFTSSDRTYGDVEIMRKLVCKDVDSAMEYALKYTISDLANKGLPIHPDTVYAYNQIIVKLSNKGDIK